MMEALYSNKNFEKKFSHDLHVIKPHMNDNKMSFGIFFCTYVCVENLCVWGRGGSSDNRIFDLKYVEQSNFIIRKNQMYKSGFEENTEQHRRPKARIRSRYKKSTIISSELPH